jgi:D-alanyl-D-alanine carboxypeptidase
MHLAILMATAILLFDPASAQARYAALVMDADSGEVLYARNADTRNHPASLTKMMTLYMVFEALDGGKLTLDQGLPVSRRAAGQAPSNLGLKVGETIRVEDAIRALAIKSANDVATVVAEAIGGTEVEFARLMTRRARELGMQRTTFTNASGLPNRRQLSTARDMAILGKVLLDQFPHYYGYFSDLSFTYDARTYSNHNKLLRSYEGMDGIKTGYIRASGFNLVASATRNGVRLIGVVFGGKTGQSRDTHMASLLNRSWDKAFESSTVAALPTPKPIVSDLDVEAADDTQAAPPNRLAMAPAGGHLDWGVQVGAFRGFSNARVAAGQAALGLRGLPATATIEVLPVNDEGSILYRARIVGMDQDIARNICRQLRSSGSPCVMVTPDGDIQMAEAGN